MSGIGMALAMIVAHPVILGATPAPVTADVAGQELVQGESDAYLRMAVQVNVHGAGPYRFLIDTGSQRTVVSTALAGTLKLQAGPRVRVIGIAGIQEVATARVDTLALGPRSFNDLIVPLLERNHIGADGILGTDSLQHQRVLLDFGRNTMAVGDLAATGGRSGYEIVVRARQRSGRLILTDALIDGVRTDVVIDTGASGTVGNRALQKAVARRQRQQALVGSLSGVTGHEIAVDLIVADKVRIGALDIGNVPIAYADAPAFRELKLDRKPAIFLGMRELRAFKRVAIDFSSRKVMFDLNETR